VLVGIATVANLVAGGVVAPLIELAHVQARYVGAFPQAFFVFTMAAFLAREYATRGERTLASERRFRALIEGAPTGVRVSRSGVITYVNRRDVRPGERS
jgi:PAS domain-containing protein